MPHLIVKQKPSFSSVVLLLIGGYVTDEQVAEMQEKMKLIPRPPKTPSGHWERTNRDEWSWTAPDLALVDRVLLILFDKLEGAGWTIKSNHQETIKGSEAFGTTWVFHTGQPVHKVYVETAPEGPKTEEEAPKKKEKKDKKDKKDKNDEE